MRVLILTLIRQLEKLYKAIEAAYEKKAADEKEKEKEEDAMKAVKELETKVLTIQDNVKKIDKAEKVSWFVEDSYLL